MDGGNSIKITKTSWTFVSTNRTGLDTEWIFFATSHGKSPCDVIGGSVKCHAAKRSLEGPMNNQVLDYQAMLNAWEEEMRKIRFFGISKETMDEVRKSLEERFSGRNTVPVAQSSHHFKPLSSSKIVHTLSSEDESHAATHDFNLPTTFQSCNIRPMTYMTCLYNSFWWVGLVIPSWCGTRWCQSSIYVSTWAT